MGFFSLFGNDGKRELNEAPKPEAVASGAAPTRMDSDPSREVRFQRRSNREHLFALVRSALASVSLPAKTYKFKVMSLDAAGTSFVVMIDLAGSPDGALAALKTVEDLIRSTAAVGQDLQVQGVYWHFDPPSPAPQPSSTDAPRGAQDALAQRTPTGSVLEQIGVDEMLAFRASQERGREQLARKKVADLNEALDRGSPKGGSGTRSSKDAQKSDGSPLSPTQFGDL